MKVYFSVGVVLQGLRGNSFVKYWRSGICVRISQLSFVSWHPCPFSRHTSLPPPAGFRKSSALIHRNASKRELMNFLQIAGIMLERLQNTFCKLVFCGRGSSVRKTSRKPGGMPPTSSSEGVNGSCTRPGDQCFSDHDLDVHHGASPVTGGLFEISLCRNEIYDARDARTIRSVLLKLNKISYPWIRFAHHPEDVDAERQKKMGG